MQLLTEKAIEAKQFQTGWRNKTRGRRSLKKPSQARIQQQY
jgi:hypothetical protein